MNVHDAAALRVVNNNGDDEHYCSNKYERTMTHYTAVLRRMMTFEWIVSGGVDS